MTSIRSVLSITLVMATPLSAQKHALPKEDVALISAGSEQAVKIDDTILSRPFGSQLVDRLAIAGRYKAGADRFYLIRGDGGGECPARYVIITTGKGMAPKVSEPFGTCSRGATGRISGGRLTVSMPATAVGGPPVRFVQDNGVMRLLDARPAAVATTPGGAAGFAPTSASSCRSPAGVDSTAQAAVIADFDRGYPAEYRRISSVQRADITPATLRSVVTGLACLSTWPGAQEVVPNAATPLFASKRHGRAAFTVLDTIAQDPLSDVNMKASVRAFSAEMQYRVARRSPI